MEGKMAAEAFGHARNYGWDGPFKYTPENVGEEENPTPTKM